MVGLAWNWGVRGARGGFSKETHLNCLFVWTFHTGTVEDGQHLQLYVYLNVLLTPRLQSRGFSVQIVMCLILCWGFQMTKVQRLCTNQSCGFDVAICFVLFMEGHVSSWA